MTAATLAPSAYPAAVEALIPPARKLAEQLGEVPSRNRLMKEFKVGAPKGIDLREAMTPNTPPAPSAPIQPSTTDPDKITAPAASDDATVSPPSAVPVTAIP